MATTAITLVPASASATVGTGWLRPVAGRVVRPFRAPMTRYGAGHLGVDFAAVPGTAVHAVGAGTVVFAGVVANVRHVVVRHASGWRTSYAFLASIAVRRGEAVERGAVLGTTGGRGANHDGRVLHLGLRIGDSFVDPMQLFAPLDLSGRVHLISGAARPRTAAPRSSPDEPRALLAGLASPTPVVVQPVQIVLEARSDPSPICDHRAPHSVTRPRDNESGGPIHPG